MPTLTTAGEEGAAPVPVQPDQSRAGDRFADFAPPKKGRRAWKPTFILAFENTGTVKAAAKAARVSKQRAYEAKAEDPAFAEAWEQARDHVVALLEETATERALAGDGRMIEFMLKANRPAKYREQASSAAETATEEIEQGVNEAIEGMAAEIERLTDRLADVAPAGEAESPRAATGGALAPAS